MLLWIIMIAPAVLLAAVAQMWVKSAYSSAAQVPAKMSGAAAAQRMLKGAGIDSVGIEEVPGHLSDHYDPRSKMLRLSREVFHGRTMAAVGIAAHEAGHAIQDARNYFPLVIRNAAVPAANFGSSASMIMLMLGFFLHHYFIFIGLALFGCVVFFQIVNLPVEFNASSRAKHELVYHGIVDQDEMGPVSNVLRAAALTYVAATLQAVLQLMYFVIRFTGGRR